MPEHDVLDRLVQELLARPARHRRAILKALTPTERSRVETLLAPPEAGPDRPEGIPADRLVEGHSAMIAGRLRVAMGDQPAPQAKWKMAPAARRQLLQSAQDIQGMDEHARKSAPSLARRLPLGGWLSRMTPR